MKGFSRLILGLLCMAAVGMLLYRYLKQGEMGEERFRLPEKWAEELGAEELLESAEGLLENAGTLMEGLLDEYTGFEGYDIDDATMFEKAYPVLEGEVIQTVELEGIRELDVEIGGCAMEILVSESREGRVESENAGKLQVYREEDTLNIKATRKAQEDAGECLIRLYLPAGYDWKEVMLEVGAGSIRVESLQAQSAKLQTGVGKMEAEGVNATQLELMAGAGEISLRNVDTVRLKAEVGVGTITVQGNVQETVEANCAVGKIKLMLAGQETDFNYELSGVIGSIALAGMRYDEKIEEKKINNGAKKWMDLDCSVGNIEIIFP